MAKSNGTDGFMTISEAIAFLGWERNKQTEAKFRNAVKNRSELKGQSEMLPVSPRFPEDLRLFVKSDAVAAYKAALANPAPQRRAPRAGFKVYRVLLTDDQVETFTALITAHGYLAPERKTRTAKTPVEPTVELVEA